MGSLRSFHSALLIPDGLNSCRTGVLTEHKAQDRKVRNAVMLLHCAEQTRINLRKNANNDAVFNTSKSAINQ
jgi:hypothetical protein